MKRSPLRRKVPLRPKQPWLPKRKPLKQASKKQSKRLRTYAKVREDFLSRHRDKPCVVAQTMWGLNQRVTDIHHVRGRTPSLLCDERYFLAVSRKSHQWLHDNPAEARKHGWLVTNAAREAVFSEVNEK